MADPTGAIIPGATVTLTDTTTNHTDTTTSNGRGVYTFNALPPNNFTLTVTAPGSKKKTLNNVQLLPEQANAVNVQLALGASAQTVTVNGSQVNLLSTETATLSGTVTSNEIQHLPSFNRDVFQLAQLAPGTFGDASQGSSGGGFNLPGSAGPGGSAAAGILSKNFGLPNNRVLGSKAVFEVKADAYNVFNKLNLNGGSMDNLVGSANPDGTISCVNAHFGVVNGALGGRTVQLQARFSF